MNMDFKTQRKNLLIRLGESGIVDDNVLKAIEIIPKERFVPTGFLPIAYEDMPIPLWGNRSIAHPLIMSLVLQSLEIIKNHKVLELGTNSGYQTALLSILAGNVISIEPSLEMALTALLRLRSEHRNVHIYSGDCSKGLSIFAPYDAIVSNITFTEFPKILLSQLNTKGKFVFPISDNSSDRILLVKRNEKGYSTKKLIEFKPLPENSQVGKNSIDKPSGDSSIKNDISQDEI